MIDYDTYRPLVDTHRLNKVRAIKMENDAIALVLDGKTYDQTVQYISTKYKVDHKEANSIYNKAHVQITDRKNYEVDSMIELHLGRYEDIYAKFIEMRSYYYASSVLRAKEKLLQFHKHSTHMKVTNNNISEITVRDVKSDYDVNRLELNKRERFKQLLDKAMLTI